MLFQALQKCSSIFLDLIGALNMRIGKPDDNLGRLASEKKFVQPALRAFGMAALLGSFAASGIAFRFVTEDFQGASPYYENTISIRRLNERPEYWKELSTNDRNQAFAWSESSSVYSAYYRKLVSERETEKFFEFRRVWEEHPNDAILSRVHKSTYLDRSMCDRLRQRDTIAVFKGEVDTATVKELVEYLWYAGNYNFGGAKVLCTSVFDRGSNIEYHLFHTEVSFGDWDLSDHITVSRSIFRVKKGTGTVNYTKQLLRVVEGKRN